MTLKEFSEYCLAIASQAGTEPSASPILDAGEVVEFLLPVVLREATRQAFKHDRYLQSLVEEYQFTVLQGRATLPAGWEEEFSRSFTVGDGGDGVVVVADAVSYESETGLVGTNPEVFEQEHVGMYAIFRDNSGNYVASGLIQEFLDIQSVILEHSGVVAAPVAGSLTIYETTWVAEKEYENITVIFGDPPVTNSTPSPTVVFAEDDVDCLIQIFDGENVVTRGVIEEIQSPTVLNMYADAYGTIGSGSATIYRRSYPSARLGLFSHYPHYGDFDRGQGDILPRFCVKDQTIFVRDADDAMFDDGTELILQGVKVPQVPTLESTAIPVGDQILDECLSIAASVMRGERTLASLGIALPAK